LRFLRHVLRIYSYLFETALSLAAIAMSAVMFSSPHQTVRIGWLPWPQETLGDWLAGLGVLGLILVILAMAGRARILLTLFALGACLLICRGLFFSSWRFSGAADFRLALWFAAALFLAFLGAIPMGPREKDDFRRRSG